MTDPWPYEEELYLVWGLHGILLVDCDSHVQAMADYRGHFGRDTVVEHVMLAPNPESWAPRRPEPDPDGAPHPDCDTGECQACHEYYAYKGFPPVEVSPDDPRLAGLDVESLKAELDACIDQRIAWSRDHGAYWHTDERGPKDDELPPLDTAPDA